MSSVTERRCHGCGHFYPKTEESCPACGKAAHAFNKGLRTQQLNTHLQKMGADTS